MKKVEAESLGTVHTHTHTHTVHLENRKATTKNEISIKELYESTKVNEQNKNITMFSKNKENAITLIALVITIIVLLILAGVSIAMLTGTNGILTQAQKAKMSTELSSYKEQLELYKTEKLSENREFLESTLTVGKESLKYNTQPEGEIGNIKTVIPNIKDEYIDKVEIIKGSLLINTQDKNEIEIAKSLGIASNPYDIVNGELLSSNGNLLLMDETGTLTIPDSVTKIGEGAFANLDGLKTIIIPGTVKEIGESAFAYNKTLETVIMQEGVEKIDGWAFTKCTSLKNVSMPNSLKEVGGMCYFVCTSLENIEFPDGITIFPQYILADCLNLKSVKIPSKLETIYEYAFSNTSISTIDIPNTVTGIGPNIFYQCNKLENIELNNNKNYKYEGGFLTNNIDKNIIFISDKYLKKTNTLEIPEGVTSFNIGISNYDNLTKIVIPSTLTSLGEMILPKSIGEVKVTSGNTTFIAENGILYDKVNKRLKMCYSKEENIKIQEGIEIIGNDAFLQSENAIQITLPESATTIVGQAFNGCEKLQQVNIGKKVTSISPVMMLWSNKANVVIDKDNPIYMTENGILYSKDKKTLYAMLYSASGEFEVDSGVESIGMTAFNGQQITKLILPEGLKTISQQAFTQCAFLESVEIPSTVTTIETGAFERCENLTSMNIKQKANSIAGAPWGIPKGMKVINWNV